MEGEVTIKIPTPEILEEDQCSAEGFLIFLIEYFQEIHWTKIIDGFIIKELLLKQLRDLNIVTGEDSTYFNKSEALAGLDHSIMKGKNTIHQYIFKLANPAQSRTITINRFKEVARLQDGCSFGELALLKNDGRAATIQCATQTRFATLHRKDYIWTIGQEEKRKLKEVVTFFRGFRIFANLRANVIEKVVKYMEKMDFKRGQKVYCEGSSRVDGLYFIT